MTTAATQPEQYPDDDTTGIDALPATYKAADIEPALYRRWMNGGVFTAHVDGAAQREPFVIVMPPPNVTAVLHVGHGLNDTVQDVLVRWRRMAGDETLWLPGTDHAGIATQNVVEKLVAAEGHTRFDIGREAFVERVESFVAETGGEILQQLQAIGASADWSRTAYTFSPALSRAVREAFVRLFEDGLVYKGHRVIHWCPRCGTSLSDEEAEFKDAAGKLYHLRYMLADDPTESIVVATTRPETMLGDSAVAVNPNDERYAAFVGRDVVLPLTGVTIPVIADEYTDPAFGSGAVKITPAHDANDFEVGKRHQLPMPVVIDADGVVREVELASGRVPDELNGLDRFAARTRIVQMLDAAGALVRIEPHQHSVRHCYRCDTVVEPRLSDQWFVRMQPLAAKALEALRSKRLRILPERWEAVYVNWLEGIRDWNISRQIWWGHRVPVWYCDACGATPIVLRDDVTACPSCGGAVRQDEDVLDTWFSSWLWPFSTLGWPDEQAPDLRAFYPGDVLVTAPEILFFWVSRMVMAGCWFMGEPPFHTVYLHGTVRDMQHRKMSKSLGNGIDPLDVVEAYGADALRWTMVAGLGLGVDVMLNPDDLESSFAPGRNFCTKLWNISRFLLTRVGAEPVRAIAEIEISSFTAADAWILQRRDVAIAECDAALGPPRPSNGVTWADGEHARGLRLSEFAETARRFVWNELADWYLESAKPRLAADGEDREVTRAVLVHVFDSALRLLHPIVPFISETLWQQLPRPSTPDASQHAGDVNDDTSDDVHDDVADDIADDIADEHRFLARAEWPRARAIAQAPACATSPEVATLSALASQFAVAQEVIQGIRQIRSDYDIRKSLVIDVFVAGDNVVEALDGQVHLINAMTRSDVALVPHAPEGIAAHVLLSNGASVVIPLADLVDLDRERARIGDERESLLKALTGLDGRLANERFVSKAPAELVAAERAKSADWHARLARLDDKLRALDA